MKVYLVLYGLSLLGYLLMFIECLIFKRNHPEFYEKSSFMARVYNFIKLALTTFFIYPGIACLLAVLFGKDVQGFIMETQKKKLDKRKDM